MQITDEGLIKLLEGMKRSKTLTKLNLSGTKIKSHSVKLLLDICAVTHNPTHLQLTNTKLSDKTSVRISTMLAQRGPAGVLRYLDVQQCQFSKKAVMGVCAF